MDFEWKDNRGWTFSIEEALLWIMGIFYQKPQFKVKRHNNGFVSNKHATFTFQDVFTFPRCPMTAPIHCRGSIGEQVEKKTHLHLRWPEGECISANVWVICSFNAIECILPWCISFKSILILYSRYSCFFVCDTVDSRNGANVNTILTWLF